MAAVNKRVRTRRLVKPEDNRLLAALSEDVKRRLLTRLELVQLVRGQVLCEAGEPARYAYFPTSGLASIIALTGNGGAVGIAAVGNDGAIGWPGGPRVQATPHEVVVQVPGAALRILLETLRQEFRRAGLLQDTLLHYTESFFGQVSQSVVCHRFHTVSQRLAHWLLTVRDRSESDTLRLTQNGIARVLGIPRTGVTAAAVDLKDAGMIWYRHGRIVIVNRERLQRAACDCSRMRQNTARPTSERE
jgi:CRP-like cAMP-binding protein